MPIKRRGFVKSLLLAPALNAQQTPQPQPQPVPQPNTPAVQTPRQSGAPALLKTTHPDLAAEPYPRFFSNQQFAVLEKLGALLMPALNGNPGALEAKAPQFLDFLISVSPSDRQKLYRDGLEQVELHAQRQFHKHFAELDRAQADSVLRPLLTVRPWPLDFPSDPLKDFVAQVHEDLRTATMNSREWAAAAEKTGRRFSRGSRSSGLYWKPIDPLDGE